MSKSESQAPQIDGVECEVVIAGMLQRIKFAGGTNPVDILPYLRTLDANVKVRDSFPMKGGGGNRETKQARALVINARITDGGKFVEMVCSAEGEDITVSVPKSKVEVYLESLKAVGKLKESSFAKIEKAFSTKTSATHVLKENEHFGVCYWKTDDGKNFMESMVSDAPAQPEGKDE